MRFKTLATGFIHVGMVGLMACSQLPQSVAGEGNATPPPEQLAKRQDIKQVLNTSSTGTFVFLRGKIGEKVPLLGGLVYQLRDDSGSIWVMTRGAVPNLGDEIFVAGKVSYQNIEMNGRNEKSIYIEQQGPIYKMSPSKHP
jgi:hypothetical protein